ncbi:hypothetical protein FR483_n145L [Paramecium bursaria Chlorella virus FR483]|uniref:Uncharacterized protein n145L n=1 Tax=Paramecium bursaria Chlorella virus FR483 TaxID=399781 RepID=A7J6J9_PBCVF|nr:hypothetical protein FR483_n145L [Paramecium bursaria Chlorella virus FR483]ABT15430.1 hypothetical protein FR483_n145L [Paramecium bursaria Chlorella virus FR483]
MIPLPNTMPSIRAHFLDVSWGSYLTTNSLRLTSIFPLTYLKNAFSYFLNLSRRESSGSQERQYLHPETRRYPTGHFSPLYPGHLLPLTLIISDVLHSLQHIPIDSPGILNIGCFPHGHLLLTTSNIPGVLHSEQQIPVSSPGRLYTGRFLQAHFLFLTSTISSVLQSLQYTPASSPGRLYTGCFPHGHFLFLTSTISSVLQSLQQIPMFSPGRLYIGFFPQGHLLFFTLIISSVLCSLHHLAFEPPVLYNAFFLHSGCLQIVIHIQWFSCITYYHVSI